MKARTAIVLLLLLAPVRAQQRATAPQNEAIRREHMRADIAFLASDALKGRLTGSPEVAIAAEFIKSRFERLGLKPVGPGGSYFQPFNLVTATLGGENRLETPARDSSPDLRHVLHPGQDYYPLRFSANAEATGDLVYVGFGISAEDYRDLTPGSIVLALDHEPGERDPKSPFEGLVTSEASSALRKTLLAQERGAHGILFVSDVHNHPGQVNFEASWRGYWPRTPPRVERYDLQDWVDKVRIPAVQISPSLAQTLVGPDRALRELSQSAESVGGMTPLPLRRTIALTASIDRHVVTARNVVGLLEGSDPALKNEWIIICGHHDHNGADEVQIFPGADDDASGVAAVIDIAEAYVLAAGQNQRPKRSVLFAAWDAEERGLLGAWAYTERPLAALTSTVAVLNLDMISRNEEVPDGGDGRFRGLAVQTSESNSNSVNLLGGTRFPWLQAEVERANRLFGLAVKAVLDNNVSQLLRRSDHWPFMQRGVPAIWFLTGLHTDYHTTWDRTDRLNLEKMERIARMVHQMSWNLTEQGAPPRAGAAGETPAPLR